MNIERYTDKYLNDLTCLVNQWTSDIQFDTIQVANQINMINNKSDNQIFVAVDDDGRAVGYILTGVCYYLFREPYVEIIQLLVDKDNRCSEIGTKLIEYISKYYDAQGITKIKLHSRIERAEAHEFYRKCGFNEFKVSKFFKR
jgi:ribosomal protein S18 acetylase RimI-like enzyme